MASSLSIAASNSTAGDSKDAVVNYLYPRRPFLHGLRTFKDKQELQEGGNLTRGIKRIKLERLRQ